MAEGFARHLLGPDVRVQSAGSHPVALHPMTLEVMSEVGIDISDQFAKPVESIDINSVDTVVTLCAEEICPVFPGKVRRLHWPIPDPADGGPAKSPGECLQRFREIRDQIGSRISVFAALLDRPAGLDGHEFHTSIRVRDLPQSTRFYAWLLDVNPKEWTHRYAIFIREDLGLNFVLMVSDDMTLHHDTLYHLGIAVQDKSAVVEAFNKASTFGAHIEKPPRTTWKGTPLHELWLADPDGNLIEIYARVTEEELAAKPHDEAPVYLVPGTEKGSPVKESPNV